MVGYTAPNRYQPRAKWTAKLVGWVQNPPPNVGSWQVDISLYWRWRTLQGMSVMEAWTQLRMHPNNAATSLHPDAFDKGLIPPELFSRVLARSRATGINPNDDVADVIIDPEPTAAVATEAAMAAAPAEDRIEVGYNPPTGYMPRAKWKNRLDRWVQDMPPNAGSWQVDISLYWRWRTLKGLSVMEAWTQLRMSPNNAATSLHRNAADRGLIPPELFSRVLARSRATTANPNDDVDDVIIYPEPTA